MLGQSCLVEVSPLSGSSEGKVATRCPSAVASPPVVAGEGVELLGVGVELLEEGAGAGVDLLGAGVGVELPGLGTGL